MLWNVSNTLSKNIIDVAQGNAVTLTKFKQRMKRSITVFLLINMVFAGIPTTWNLHYCRGILRSVTLADRNAVHCCGNDGRVEQRGSPDIPQVNKLCCYDCPVDIATDSFESQRPVAGTVHGVLKPFLLYANTLKLFEPACFPVSQHVFPPGKPAKYNADLLTWICVFRI
jgi:hypothetical protein